MRFIVFEVYCIRGLLYTRFTVYEVYCVRGLLYTRLSECERTRFPVLDVEDTAGVADG